MTNSPWHCNKCGSKERVMMNGKCAFCYGSGQDDKEINKIKSQLKHE